MLCRRFLDAAVEAALRPLLVCFNRPLAERLKQQTVGASGEPAYGLVSTFLQAATSDDRV
jgi:hypothetical protein